MKVLQHITFANMNLIPILGPSLPYNGMVVGFTTTYVITTDVSLNLDQGEVYNIM